MQVVSINSSIISTNFQSNKNVKNYPALIRLHSIKYSRAERDLMDYTECCLSNTKGIFYGLKTFFKAIKSGFLMSKEYLLQQQCALKIEK